MRLSRLAACIAIVAHPALTAAQGVPPRAVRRDIPMTNAIRRAFAGGSRDSTGRPGRNYWQLKTDYTIAVRLDAPTSRLYGTETIALVNNSPDTLRQVALRLPMNHFLFNVPRAATWVPGTPAHSWQAVACGGTAIGTKGMMVAAQTLALTAIDLFSNPALMKKAQEEFQQKLGDYKYEPLLGNRKPALNYRD